MRCPHCDDGLDRQDRRRSCPYCRGSCLVCDRCKARVGERAGPWPLSTLCRPCWIAEDRAVMLSRSFQAGYVLDLLRHYAEVTWLPGDPDHWHVAFDVRRPPGDELRESARCLKPEILAILRREHRERHGLRERRR